MHRETDFDDLTGSSLMRLADRSDASLLRVLSMLLGVAWSLAFIAVGCGSRLQMYGDGSIFSYAIAAEQAWAFHWHNISGRIFVFLIAHWPAELYVRASGDTNAGIALHGLLFFSAPLAGLVATWKADLSECRTIFHHACVSTAVICPLVFGFPTEMWVAHAVFWPTLALAHAALETFTRRALLAAGLTALVLSHGGGVVLGGFIVVSTVLARPRHSFKHPLWSSVIVALTVWAAVLLAFRPDPYIAKVINTAAFSFIDLRNLIDPVVLVIIAAVTGYAVTATACSWMLQLRSSSAVALVAALLALVIYYVHFDTALLADARYPLRTALLVIPPLLAAPAILGMEETGRNFPRIGRLVALSRRLISPRHLAAALLLAATVHTVETAKFVRVGATTRLSQSSRWEMRQMRRWEIPTSYRRPASRMA